VPLDPCLNVVRALAGAELDDPKVREPVFEKRIFLDDGFDLPSILADGQDDPAISRYLSTRDQEIAGSVVLLQENDVRGHVRVNFDEVGLVGKFDNEHGRSAWINHTVVVKDDGDEAAPPCSKTSVATSITG
jgi:hypothetical protein